MANITRFMLTTWINIAGTRMKVNHWKTWWKTWFNFCSVRNNGGGHWNSYIFLEQPGSQMPAVHLPGKLADAINEAFGSFDAFKEKLPMQVWHVWQRLGLVDRKERRQSWIYAPQLTRTIFDGCGWCKGVPILGVDVWETHITWNTRIKRADYLAAFWNVVNWNKVAKRY